MEPYRIGFVLEQVLGHRTHSQNIQSAIGKDGTIDPLWILPDWQAITPGSRIPFYRSNWTVQSGWQARRGLNAAARGQRLDGLFFHTQVPAVLSVDWIRHYPSIISLDATPLQYDSLGKAYHHNLGPGWLENLKIRLNKACFEAAHHLVSWSQWAKDGLINDYAVPEEKITVIPPGVLLGEWRNGAVKPKKSGVVKILFVGGDLKRKGGLDLLDAFLSFRNRISGDKRDLQPRLELHLVTQTLVVAAPDIFVYPDLKPNSLALKQLYHDADIFCLPTYGDCLPVALAEAGAANLPLISTRIAAIPELVQDGINGYLIPPGDVRQLAEALDSLVCDPLLRKSMGEQSLHLIESAHDADRNVKRLLELIRSTIDHARQS